MKVTDRQIFAAWMCMAIVGIATIMWVLMYV